MEASSELSIYLCKHKRTNAIFLSAVAKKKDVEYTDGVSIVEMNAVKSYIRQLLAREVTPNSPSDKKEIYQFIRDKRLNVESYQIPFEWEIQLLERVGKYDAPVRIAESVERLRSNGYVVLNTSQRCLPKRRKVS